MMLEVYRSPDGRLWHNGAEVVVIQVDEYVKALQEAVRAGYSAARREKIVQNLD